MNENVDTKNNLFKSRMLKMKHLRKKINDIVIICNIISYYRHNKDLFRLNRCV